MEKIAILVAIYNGRKWLDEQLTSILQQAEVEVDIFISVDLSSDSSYEYICDKYSSFNNIFILPYGMRYGSAGKNFYRLILDVDFTGYNYIAFADQDDIWYQNKLTRAVSLLANTEYDAYSSNVLAFWESGKECVIDKAQPQVKYDYLFEAAGPGCTYVFKNKLAQNFKSFIFENNLAKTVVLHDWLLYAYARANEYRWYIDEEPSMLYRQHSNNEVGANNNIRAAYKRIKLSRQGWYRTEILKLSNMFCKNTNKIFNSLNENGLFNRLYLLMNVKNLRRRNRDRLAIAILLLFNIM